MVGEVAINVREVDRQVQRAMEQHPLDGERLRALQARTLAVLIDRELILAYLTEHKLSASTADVDLSVSRMEKTLAQQEVPLADYLHRAGMDEGQFRRNWLWRLSWQRYLQRYMTDENLQRYFDKHRPHYDGTQVRVAHILLKPADSSDASREAIDRQAELIRRQINDKELTFEQAAQQHSSAPTAGQGGDVGWISRHSPMPEAFSKAAFDLPVGGVSNPVETAAGVHLIKVLEVKPGQQTWQQVREQLTRDVTAYLFRWTADQQRTKTRIQYTGQYPYLVPGTMAIGDQPLTTGDR
jgi:parvulin-like peptidyl-prolyl isomerase